MCASALRELEFKRVVFACSNDRFGGCGSILNVASDEKVSSKPQLEVVSGIYVDEAIGLLKTFYKGENPHAPDPVIKK